MSVSVFSHAIRESFISINAGSNPFIIYNQYNEKSPVKSTIESGLAVSGLQVGLGYNILDNGSYYGFFGIGVATFSGLQNYFYPLYLKYGYEFMRESAFSLGFETHLGVGMKWGDNNKILVLDERLKRDYITAFSIFLQLNAGVAGFSIRAGVLPDRIYSEYNQEPFDEEFADEEKVSLKKIIGRYSFLQCGISVYF